MENFQDFQPGGININPTVPGTIARLLEDVDEANFFVCNISAKKLANAVFTGYGKLDQEIIYHHTYYE